MDRLVEDMIQESMSKGDFQNLPGAGKPLNLNRENPHMDKVTQKMNQILIDNDFQPEWILKQKEIRLLYFILNHKINIAENNHVKPIVLHYSFHYNYFVIKCSFKIILNIYIADIRRMI